MNKKKEIIICAVVVALVLLTVGLIFWFGRDKAADDPVEAARQEQAAETTQEAATEPISEEETKTEEKNPDITETESAQLIEDGGEVTIIIPEGQASDGF